MYTKHFLTYTVTHSNRCKEMLVVCYLKHFIYLENSLKSFSDKMKNCNFINLLLFFKCNILISLDGSARIDSKK